MAAINIEEVCSPADIPTMVSVANITGVDLTAEEGFLLSRIDGHTPVTGVLQLSSFDASTTLELLASLYSKGLINFTHKDGQTWSEYREAQKGKSASKRPVGASNGAAKPAPAGLDEEELFEEIVEEVPDLSIEQCKQILALHKQVTEAKNPYEVLGVPRDAKSAALKKRHREVAMKWHPDRFFRKEIGQYKEMIKTIFAISHEAYEVLIDENQRKALDNDLKLEEYRKQREDDKKKSGERNERIARKDKSKESIWARKLKKGLKDRILKAKRHFEKAKDDFEKKRFASASSNIQLAMTYDPWNEEYPKYWDQIRPEVDDAIYKEAMRRGANHEAMVDYSLAQAEYKRAVAAKPDDAEAAFRLGRVLMKLGDDLRQAKDLLQKASLDRPEDIEVLLALGAAYKMMGMHRNALRTFEKVKSLDRKHEQANKEIKELKRKV